MNTSKLLGATMVAGALATGGAFAGISSAGAASSSTTSGTATTQSTTPTTPTPATPTTPPAGAKTGTTPPRERPRGSTRARAWAPARVGVPAPVRDRDPARARAFRAVPPERAPSSKDITPSGRWRPGPHRGEALARRGGSSADDRSCQQALFPGERLAGGGGDLDLGELARRGET